MSPARHAGPSHITLRDTGPPAESEPLGWLPLLRPAMGTIWLPRHPRILAVHSCPWTWPRVPMLHSTQPPDTPDGRDSSGPSGVASAPPQARRHAALALATNHVCVSPRVSPASNHSETRVQAGFAPTCAPPQPGPAIGVQGAKIPGSPRWRCPHPWRPANPSVFFRNA